MRTGQGTDAAAGQTAVPGGSEIDGKGSYLEGEAAADATAGQAAAPGGSRNAGKGSYLEQEYRSGIVLEGVWADFITVTMTTSLFHLCVKSNGEVMFRDDDDYRCGISKMAMAAIKTKTRIYAYAFMSTHMHIVALTDDTSRFMSVFRNSYTKRFNHKYMRSGKLGDKGYYAEPLDTLNRTLSAVNYVLRNPVHHSVSDTALGYEYCSARYLFEGDVAHPENTLPKKSKYIPRHTPNHKQLRSNPSGMISPSSFLDISAVEQIYMTPKNFLFYINRPSYRDLEKVSMQENEQRRITIADIEPYENIDELQKNERQRSTKGSLTDQQLCSIIDLKAQNNFKKAYTQLSAAEKRQIATDLLKLPIRPTKEQIIRCLVL